jgi:hypothetical protein
MKPKRAFGFRTANQKMNIRISGIILNNAHLLDRATDQNARSE